MSEIQNNNVISLKHVGLFYYSGKKVDDFRSFVLDKIQLKKTEKIKRWVIHDISFEGYKGEILGIIGSNGAGKTTICRIIGGLLKPDKGAFVSRGIVSTLLSLGVGFNNELSGRENIFLNGTMLGYSKKQLKNVFNAICEFSGLNDFIEVPVKKYSTGMRIRLGFSIAAFTAPETLVLDETLSTGDYHFSEKAAKKIEELIAKAKMIIVVTHDMNFIKKRCSRAFWVDKGIIEKAGNPDEVVDTYLANLKRVSSIGPTIQSFIDYNKTKSDIKERCVIKAEHLGVYFKINKQKFWALKDVSFTIKEGEIVGIIGNNGAGKSTLCKTLAGIYKPNEGALFVSGKTSSLLGLGTGFNGQLSVIDNIYLNGMMMGVPKKKLKALKDVIIEFAGLREHIDKPLKNYSSGMRSKLGFSISAAIQPELLIIDEALSAGDTAFQKKASEAIQELIKKAESVLVVTHNLEFVKKVCNRTILFENGHIIGDGNPKEIIEKYISRINKKV